MNQWSDIGEQMQESREKRGLSLQDVAHETRIPLGTLQALEKTDYSSFPSPAYTRSFLQQYSEYLRIDAHEIIEKLDTGNVLAATDGIEYLDQKKSSSGQRSAPIRRNPSAKSKEPPVDLAQPLLILLITGALIAGGFWGFFAVEKRLNRDPEPREETTTQEAADGDAKPASPEEDRPPRIITPGTPGEVASTDPEAVELPVFIFPEGDPPPRAIIVDEDELENLVEENLVEENLVEE